MRVYIPATCEMLEHLRDSGDITPLRGWGFAVTQQVRDFFDDADEDELADVALTDAALASLRLLTHYDGDFPHRRVVVAADVDATEDPEMGETVVRIAGAVPLAKVSSVHVDVAAAESLVATALPEVDKADLGDEDAELTVGDAQELELAWYDVSELPVLLELI
ncbi:hypothetical protein KRX51_02665 [Corynebacterium sp. TAE3-ERU12]|uniref:DUF6912 family protein n=1 Tax=Corynebacterium sp. TAE3-ERU12 TaxID=2849491 RepID=UPI001C45C4A9|nr:hypothetical protein [Corynebacterium sp. TAE3-ERU12]MBV7294824.1 hypothetical protein [Corynebacterium sp. TAE3-ERU12]